MTAPNNTNNESPSTTSEKSLESCGFSTRAVHVGQEPDPRTGATIPPISLSVTYTQEGPGAHRGYVYGRGQNPTREDLERCIASLEGASAAYTFSSGTAAAAMILELLPPNSHIVATDDIFGGTYRLFEQVKRNSAGLQVSYVDMTDPTKLDQALTSRTKLIWVETPTNPLLKIVDLEAVATIGKKHGVLTVCDGTFTSPYIQRPLEWGIDLVFHSTTKYINGHSDVLGGLVAIGDKRDLAQQFNFLQKALGAVTSPFDCYLLHRGLKTLALRMERHCSNASWLAEKLMTLPGVRRVIYPGLSSHPQHKLATKQMSGYGGMITLELAGDINDATRALKKLKLFALAESLGGVESLASHPATMTHATIPKVDRETVGITDSIVRLSIGIEDREDLLADLSLALR